MCFCDDKYFKVANVKTGKEKLYKLAACISKRFFGTTSYGCKEAVFEYMGRKMRIPDDKDGELYLISRNIHLECEQFRRRHCPRLGSIPDKCRHLLPENRR